MGLGTSRDMVTRDDDEYEEGQPDGISVRHMMILAGIELVVCVIWVVALIMASTQ